MTLPWIDLTISRDTNGDLHVDARGARDVGVPRKPLGITHNEITAFTTAVQKRAEFDQALTDEHTAHARSLHDALFHPKIIERCAELQSIQDGALLVRLAFSHVDLQKVTWEALCKPGEALGFFGMSAKYLAIRTVADGSPWEFRSYSGPARIQAIAPTDTAALVNLQGALAPRIDSRELEWLPPITGEAAKTRHVLHRLGQDPTPHILHFVGHGGIDNAGIPYLRMANDGDDEDQRLSVELLAQTLTGKNVSLVVLEACQGADPGAFASAAEMLARAGVGAVLAHLWPVRGNAGRTISVQFYQTLCAFNAGAGNVAMAANEARRVLLAENNNSARAFSTVLYMRGTDPKLFAFVQKDPGYAGSLGEQLKRDLEKRREVIVELLQTNPQVCKEVATRINVKPPSPDDVARALLSRNVSDVADALESLLGMPEGSSEARKLVERILRLALPVIVPLQNVIQAAKQEAGLDGKHPIELPVEYLLTAEIILARVDGRGCDVIVEKDVPQGLHRIPLPSTEFAPFFDQQGDIAVTAIVKNLRGSRHSDIKAQFVPKIERLAKAGGAAMQQRYRDLVTQMARALDTRLEKEAKRADQPHRTYVTYIDDELREAYDAELDVRWSKLCAALAERIPNLRVVRIKGSSEFEAENQTYESARQLLVSRE